jgi:hypothetical protein
MGLSPSKDVASSAQQSLPTTQQRASHSPTLPPSHPSSTATAPPTDSTPLTQLLERCQQLGLGPASPGYALVKKLAESTEPEWRALNALLTQGQATLLLPVQAKSSSSSAAKEGDAAVHAAPSLSFAQDHILLSPSSCPTLSSDPPEKGLATLSGLRGCLQTGMDLATRSDQGQDSDDAAAPAGLFIKSFVNRSDRAWADQLRNTAGRR